MISAVDLEQHIEQSRTKRLLSLEKSIVSSEATPPIIDIPINVVEDFIVSEAAKGKSYAVIYGCLPDNIVETLKILSYRVLQVKTLIPYADLYELLSSYKLSKDSEDFYCYVTYILWKTDKDIELNGKLQFCSITDLSEDK